MERNGDQIKRLADHAAEWFAIRGLCSILEEPGDVVLLPKELTAKNGAKAHLIGEFYEKVDLQCTECLGLGEADGGGANCEICEGTGSLIQDVPVSWATIKAIYQKIIEYYGK